MNVKTILVPTDFSADAEKALSTATELAKLFGARIVVLHAYQVDIPVVSPMAGGYTLPQGFYEDLRSQATAQVERLAKEAAAEGIEATGIALQEAAAVAIAAQAESLPADLIVMGSHGYGWFKRAWLGSVSEGVLHKTDHPLLIVPVGKRS